MVDTKYLLTWRQDIHVNRKEERERKGKKKEEKRKEKKRVLEKGRKI